MGLLRRLKILGVMLAVMAVAESHAEVQPFGEYQVKAVFLLNLTSFVKWPEVAFSAPSDPFKIIVLGDDPFKAVLDKTFKGEMVQGHPIVIERRSHRDVLPPGHLLFISSSLKRRVPDVLAGIKHSNMLTVGDHAGFCRQGGMINLIFKNNRVQIEANVRDAEKSGLQINSKLLRIAVPF